MPCGLLFQILVCAVVFTADLPRCAGRRRQVLILAIVRTYNDGTVLVRHVQTDILAVVIPYELGILGILRHHDVYHLGLGCLAGQTDQINRHSSHTLVVAAIRFGSKHEQVIIRCHNQPIGTGRFFHTERPVGRHRHRSGCSSLIEERHGLCVCLQVTTGLRDSQLHPLFVGGCEYDGIRPAFQTGVILSRNHQLGVALPLRGGKCQP